MRVKKLYSLMSFLIQTFIYFINEWKTFYCKKKFI